MLTGKHLIAGHWVDGRAVFSSAPAHGPAHDPPARARGVLGLSGFLHFPLFCVWSLCAANVARHFGHFCHCRLYKILTCLCCLHITVNYFTALYNFYILLQSFWNCVEVLTLFLCFLWMIMFFLSFALSAQTADRFRENARDFVSFEYATTWAGVSWQMWVVNRPDYV